MRAVGRAGPVSGRFGATQASGVPSSPFGFLNAATSAHPGVPITQTSQRQLHRATNQSERLQRRRLGEAVPPPLAVGLTETA